MILNIPLRKVMVDLGDHYENHRRNRGALVYMRLNCILMAPSSRSTVPFNIEFVTLCITRLENSSGLPALTGNSITLSKLLRALSDN
ncbi:hypothetical protein TMatcc_002572 [Talaromyces marneffei ATCC 18224]